MIKFIIKLENLNKKVKVKNMIFQKLKLKVKKNKFRIKNKIYRNMNK